MMMCCMIQIMLVLTSIKISTHIRITEETPKIRPNANIMGVETDVNKMKTTDYSLTFELK